MHNNLNSQEKVTNQLTHLLLNSVLDFFAHSLLLEHSQNLTFIQTVAVGNCTKYHPVVQQVLEGKLNIRMHFLLFCDCLAWSVVN